ncbi:MAG: hypothetical protein ACO3RV_10415, partial [Luteolibacter sp.]
MIPALETLMLTFSGEEGLKPPDRTLFLGARTHPGLKQFPAISGWQPHKTLADEWQNADFDRLDQPTGKWPLVMLLPGKSRDETLAYFAMARDHL